MRRSWRLVIFLVLLPFLLLLGSSVLASDVLTLLSPNGGEVISSEVVYTIQWEAPPEAVQFDLMYSMDNGITWNSIADGITGTSYDWYVPALTGNENNCRIKDNRVQFIR